MTPKEYFAQDLRKFLQHPSDQNIKIALMHILEYLADDKIAEENLPEKIARLKRFEIKVEPKPFDGTISGINQ